MAPAALAWLRSRSSTIHPIVGVRKVSQLQDNLRSSIAPSPLCRKSMAAQGTQYGANPPSGRGAVTVRGLPKHGEAVVSVFVTNGGLSGLQLW
jgi:hypothetical protein